MKITIHSLAELLELTALIRGGSVAHSVGDIKYEVTIDQAATDLGMTEAERQTLANPSNIKANHLALVEAGKNPDPACVVTTNEPGPVDADALPAEDADGAPHNTDWHSDPAKINADGTWRARRKRDETAYKDWLLSLAVEVAEAAIAADDAEPVATETHALPQGGVLDHVMVNVTLDDNGDVAVSEPYAAGVESETAPTVDHAALIEASQEAAKDAPDGTIDLLNAGKVFISEYGTATFEALKAAVSPLEDGKGKPIPSLTPGERRLLRACMDNYALYL